MTAKSFSNRAPFIRTIYTGSDKQRCSMPDDLGEMEPMEDIRKNVERIRERIAIAAAASGRRPEEIALVAVSKNHGADVVKSSLECGFAAFGENRVQEFLEKDSLGAYGGVPVHLIGTLQKNKVNKIVGKVQLIQSVDSAELAACIGRRASALGIVQDILAEVNIGGEVSKGGIRPEAADEFCALVAGISGVRLRGLMAIPPRAEKLSGNLKYFTEMYKLFVDIRGKKYDNVYMDCLSMGMSEDFETAISAGSNMIRIGTAIFGLRSR
jgi:pyridoxal phosphate enzyme (YggS family)